LSFTRRGYEVGVEAKEFRYRVTLDEDGRMLSEGESPLEPPDAWRPDHLLVAALLRCSLESLGYHAKRAGLMSSGRGEGSARVTKRDRDGRYAVVEIAADLDVALEPSPGEDAAAELLAKAERDCFVGASLTAKPAYRWIVNGRELTPAAPT
jgi:organic hydroperoxide reductase OsmC/OhrA